MADFMVILCFFSNNESSACVFMRKMNEFYK